MLTARTSARIVHQKSASERVKSSRALGMRVTDKAHTRTLLALREDPTEVLLTEIQLILGCYIGTWQIVP
jgi:hypothetical protein